MPALSSVHAVGIDKELQGAGLADWWGVHVGTDGNLSKLYCLTGSADSTLRVNAYAVAIIVTCKLNYVPSTA